MIEQLLNPIKKHENEQIVNTIRPTLIRSCYYVYDHSIRLLSCNYKLTNSKLLTCKITIIKGIKKVNLFTKSELISLQLLFEKLIRNKRDDSKQFKQKTQDKLLHREKHLFLTKQNKILHHKLNYILIRF